MRLKVVPRERLAQGKVVNATDKVASIRMKRLKLILNVVEERKVAYGPC